MRLDGSSKISARRDMVADFQVKIIYLQYAFYNWGNILVVLYEIRVLKLVIGTDEKRLRVAEMRIMWFMCGATKMD